MSTRWVENFCLGMYQGVTMHEDVAANTLDTASNFSLTPEIQTFTDSLTGLNQNDYYGFSLGSSSSLELSLRDFTTNIDVELLDSNGELLQASTNSGLEVESLLTTLDAGDYYIKVFSDRELTTDYSLNLSATANQDFLTGELIPNFDSGVFTVGSTGEVSVDYLFDGGGYRGELAIFNLEGLEQYSGDWSEFVEEAARRALSNSDLGHVVISDQTEGAKFSGILGTSDNFDHNGGTYLGPKTVSLEPGDTFGVMLVPNGTVEEVFNNPDSEGALRPLFSLSTNNPDDTFHLGQIADVVGDGTTFVMEDLRVDTGSDRDYNDIIFRFSGATGYAALLKDVIAPENDWQYSELGQKVLAYVSEDDNPEKEEPGVPTYPGLPIPNIPVPVVPSTTVDQGGNGISEVTEASEDVTETSEAVEPNPGGALPNTPTQIEASNTVDVIDQVNSTDPTDIFQVSSEDLSNTEILVLSGNTVVSVLTLDGTLLTQQILGRGNHSLILPENLPPEVLLKFENQPGSNSSYLLRGFESQAEEPFNIDLEFGAGLTASQQETIQAAATSIESLIEQGLPSAIVDGNIIDDINLKIAATDLDGAGGTLAETKIDFMRYATLLPAQSITNFDAADVAQLENSGQLFSVVQHEILHGLGFGNLWEAKGLVDYAKTPFSRYTGENAIAAFQEAGGVTDYINLETQGQGSADLHWQENLFQDELMTPDLGFQTGEAGNVFSPISSVTLASLADLGYEVNLNQATPNWGLFGDMAILAETLTAEQIKALEELAAEAEAEAQTANNIPIIVPPVDPATISPEIWAHAERFDVNGEYYDWELITIQPGDTVSQYVWERMTHPSQVDSRSRVARANDPAYWQFIVDRNLALGVVDPHLIFAGKEIWLPTWRENYEWEQEQERQQREEELNQRLEEERRERERLEEIYRDQQLEEEQRERERLEQEQGEQERLEQERREQERLEQERREQERLGEIERQLGIGGLEWWLSKPFPDFGGTAPFETSVQDVVGSQVPDDYFRFTLSRPGYVTIYLEDLLADADLYLYDSRHRLIGTAERPGVTDEKIIMNLQPGTYMVRVHSADGVATDYNLKVRFEGLPTRTQIGASNIVSGDNGSTFSDSQIDQVYNTAIAEFEASERQKVQTQLDALIAERDRLEYEKRDLIADKSAELRGRVYGMLDGVKSEQQGNVNHIANNIKGGIDGIANGAINLINGLVPDWVFNLPLVGGAIRDSFNSAKGSIEGAINGARNWLNAKVDEVRNTINGAISWFIDRVKDAYFTAGEANLAIEGIAREFRGMIENAIAGLNGLIGTFNGMILGQLDWTRNIGVGGWNLYDNAIVGLVNNLSNGAQNLVRDAGLSFMDRVGDAEQGVQFAVAEIGNLLGDATGRIYNQYQEQILSLNNQIEAITNETENRIRAKEEEYQNQIQNFLGQLGDEGKKILDTILNFADYPAGQIGIAVVEVLLGLIPGVGQALDIKDTAIALYDIFVQGQRGIWEFVGLIGALAGWVPGVGDAIKSVAKIAKNGVDALATFLGKLGPDVTKSAIKAIDSTNWGSILKNVISDIGNKWDNFSKAADNAAGWIIDALGLKPAWATANNAMLAFRNGADDIAEELTPTQRHFREAIEEANKKTANKLGNLNGNSTKLRANLGKTPTEVKIPGRDVAYPPGNYQAHHVIPTASAKKSELMKAAAEKAGYDIDSAINGIYLPNSKLQADIVKSKTGLDLPVHLGSHPTYNKLVDDILREHWEGLVHKNKTNDPQALVDTINQATEILKGLIVDGTLVVKTP
ncbi:MAG: DUF4114 domain-containing protein [Symploca sp. SIO1A3]|nr:DUF4114 domain-containing protein [Symploca sp. SIO1A3]